MVLQDSHLTLSQNDHPEGGWGRPVRVFLTPQSSSLALTASRLLAQWSAQERGLCRRQEEQQEEPLGVWDTPLSHHRPVSLAQATPLAQATSTSIEQLQQHSHHSFDKRFLTVQEPLPLSHSLLSLSLLAHSSPNPPASLHRGAF